MMVDPFPVVDDGGDVPPDALGGVVSVVKLRSGSSVIGRVVGIRRRDGKAWLDLETPDGIPRALPFTEIVSISSGE